MKIATVGIDLAKNVFQIHGINQHGKAVLKKQLERAQRVPFLCQPAPRLVGMEACGSAHHWACKLQALVHNVRLMAPQFVKPYVKANKNAVADTDAICEAVGRPNNQTHRSQAIDELAQQLLAAGYFEGHGGQMGQRWRFAH